MIVEVLERGGALWRVRTHYRYEGWASPRHLRPGDGGAARWAALPKRAVLHQHLCDALAEPRYQAPLLTSLPMGAVVAPEGAPAEGWQRVLLADGRRGYLRAGWLGTCYDRPPDLPEAELRRKIADTALLYRGSQYRWGGKTPAGIDCSGLVSMAYLLCGVLIYRDAKIVDGFPVHAIRPADLEIADLLFFPGHVALYLGEGRYCHATGRAGDDGFTVNSLDPGAPDYRADLAESITAVGSIF